MTRHKVEPTLVRYVVSTVKVVLRVVLVIAILSVFGIETTSFAALLAVADIAIGAAWAGLLANFAAGIFLILLRPFKVGDFIAAAGVTGTVREIGLFTTVIDQPDNVRTTVGNNKPFGDVRPYCYNDHYWQVYFDANKAILAAGSERAWPVPAPHQVLRQAPDGTAAARSPGTGLAAG